MPYQLNLFDIWGTPPVERILSNNQPPNTIDTIFRWFLSQIDTEIWTWIMNIPDFTNKQNHELAANFIRTMRISSRIPHMLEVMGFKRGYTDKFPQYWLYYGKIKNHIIKQIRTIKIKLSQENELKKLALQASMHNAERVANILSQKWSLDKKIQALKLLVAALTNETNV